MERELRIGQHLVFIDADREERDALLICIHGEPKGTLNRPPKIDDKGNYVEDKEGHIVYHEEPIQSWPCINLVVVDKNDGAQDQYGRQTVKEGVTSVVHWSDSTAHGFCWRFRDEVVEGMPAPSIS